MVELAITTFLAGIAVGRLARFRRPRRRRGAVLEGGSPYESNTLDFKGF